MKCYYKVLGVARDADDSNIKKAYKKLALQLHPDKNPRHVDEAKKRFQLLQRAYAVLSISWKRKIYDDHRELVLWGKNSSYEEICLDLSPYLKVSCFKGYGDKAGGFYSVYSRVFEKIRAEDAVFVEDGIHATPQFGASGSSYNDIVSPFYAYWQKYCTKKSFAWLCREDITEINDRSRLLNTVENMKKVAQEAKNKRNKEVRNLVGFVRSIDKRVQANNKLHEEKASLNRLRQEQSRLQQIIVQSNNKLLEEMEAHNRMKQEHNRLQQSIIQVKNELFCEMQAHHRVQREQYHLQELNIKINNELLKERSNWIIKRRIVEVVSACYILKKGGHKSYLFLGLYIILKCFNIT